jgi:hypothetical protein
MDDPVHRDPVRVFAGRALVAVGALILGLSGLCTLYFGGMVLVQDLKLANGYTNLITMAPFVLVIGGLPMLIGFGILRWGLSVLRKRPRPPPSAPPPG